MPADEQTQAAAPQPLQERLVTEVNVELQPETAPPEEEDRRSKATVNENVKSEAEDKYEVIKSDLDNVPTME